MHVFFFVAMWLAGVYEEVIQGQGVGVGVS
jgi:hypothetical protein